MPYIKNKKKSFYRHYNKIKSLDDFTIKQYPVEGPYNENKRDKFSKLQIAESSKSPSMEICQYCKQAWRGYIKQVRPSKAILQNRAICGELLRSKVLYKVNKYFTEVFLGKKIICVPQMDNCKTCTVENIFIRNGTCNKPISSTVKANFHYFQYNKQSLVDNHMIIEIPKLHLKCRFYPLP